MAMEVSSTGTSTKQTVSQAVAEEQKRMAQEAEAKRAQQNQAQRTPALASGGSVGTKVNTFA